tara:strand:+ start:1311 stop:1922 length:612 start_codon:yes stop_codon:yes gene_type:complete
MTLVKLKKAAMFGLDARIALAIFGALSVISGAALYSAIQKAKVTSIITDMNEIGKAWEAYYLDTGVHLSQLNTTPTHVDSAIFNAEGLVKSLSVAGWSGPYTSYEFDGSSGLTYPRSEAFRAYVTRFATSVDWSARADGLCSAGRSCAIWVRLSKFTSESLVKAIDEEVDNSDGADKGRFRWSGVAGDQDVNLQISAIQNPND